VSLREPVQRLGKCHGDRNRTTIRLFLRKRKSTCTISRARKKELACLVSVITSCKHTYKKRGFKSKRTAKQLAS
jgi:hypothetical protein